LDLNQRPSGYEPDELPLLHPAPSCGVIPKLPGGDQLSQQVAPPVSSALGPFTTVFGMGTGGPTPLQSPGSSQKHYITFGDIAQEVSRVLFEFSSLGSRLAVIRPPEALYERRSIDEPTIHSLYSPYKQ
jgi:hypothetical protein